jgi:hypothetical protein
MLVRVSLATQAGVQVCPDLMKIASCQTVWVTLNAHKRLGQSHGAVTIGGIYRQWSHKGNLLTADEERVQVESIKVQLERAKAKSDRVVITGNFNLNTHKKGQKGGAMVEAFLNDMAALGYTYTQAHV